MLMQKNSIKIVHSYAKYVCAYATTTLTPRSLLIALCLLFFFKNQSPFSIFIPNGFLVMVMKIAFRVCNKIPSHSKM